MAEYVAVTDILLGEGNVDEDGNPVNTEIKRGEVVKGLDKEHMVRFWKSGSIAEKGSRFDPNTYDKSLQQDQPAEPGSEDNVPDFDDSGTTTDSKGADGDSDGTDDTLGTATAGKDTVKPAAPTTPVPAVVKQAEKSAPSSDKK